MNNINHQNTNLKWDAILGRLAREERYSMKTGVWRPLKKTIIGDQLNSA